MFGRGGKRPYLSWRSGLLIPSMSNLEALLEIHDSMFKGITYPCYFTGARSIGGLRYSEDTVGRLWRKAI